MRHSSDASLTSLFETDPAIATLLVRVTTGEATQDEIRQLDTWSEDDPRRAMLVGDIRAAWNQSETIPSRDEVDAHWCRFSAAVIEGEKPLLERSRSLRPASFVARSRWRAIPYVFGALAVVVLGLFLPDMWSSPVPVPGSREYATQRAERLTTTLPDGTHVILGPATTLHYAESAAGSRTITLQGQAYFTVTPDASRPFTVLVAGVTTRVLGTAFAVRAYPDDVRAEVAVAEGKVGVGDQAILVAGDVAHAESDRSVRITRDAKLADVLGWTSGRLAFQHVRMSDVLPELERAYDLDFIIADSALAKRHVTLELTNEPPEHVLATIAAVAGASFERQGRTVTFFSLP